MAAADRVFVPAAFIDRLADMPPLTNPARRAAWLTNQLADLLAAVPSNHGLEALRLAGLVRRELDTVTVPRPRKSTD
jgi:hypothetical protein